MMKDDCSFISGKVYKTENFITVSNKLPFRFSEVKFFYGNFIYLMETENNTMKILSSSGKIYFALITGNKLRCTEITP